MCGCSSFTGNRPSYITSDFDGDTDYDNFLTEKMRNRRKQVKAGLDSGLSRKDARKEALASIPKIKLKEIIEKIKNGEQINVLQTPLGDVKLDPKIDDRLNELSDALKDPNANPIQEEEQSFFQKNKLYIIGGVVLVAGIFVYMKYIKK